MYLQTQGPFKNNRGFSSSKGRFKKGFFKKQMIIQKEWTLFKHKKVSLQKKDSSTTKNGVDSLQKYGPSSETLWTLHKKRTLLQKMDCLQTQTGLSSIKTWTLQKALGALEKKRLS